jgi:hypothetical protein
MGCLRVAIKALTKRKSCKRQYIRAKESLSVGKVSNLITAKEGSSRRNSEKPAKRVRAERRCSRCSETRHNSRTCKVEIEDVDNSDAPGKYYTITYSILICCNIALCRCACAALVLLGRLMGWAARW